MHRLRRVRARVSSRSDPPGYGERPRAMARAELDLLGRMAEHYSQEGQSFGRRRSQGRRGKIRQIFQLRPWKRRLESSQLATDPELSPRLIRCAADEIEEGNHVAAIVLHCLGRVPRITGVCAIYGIAAGDRSPKRAG